MFDDESEVVVQGSQPRPSRHLARYACIRPWGSLALYKGYGSLGARTHKRISIFRQKTVAVIVKLGRHGVHLALIAKDNMAGKWETIMHQHCKDCQQGEHCPLLWLQLLGMRLKKLLHS